MKDCGCKCMTQFPLYPPPTALPVGSQVLISQRLAFLENAFFPLPSEEGCFRVESRVGGLNPAGFYHPPFFSAVPHYLFPNTSPEQSFLLRAQKDMGWRLAEGKPRQQGSKSIFLSLRSLDFRSRWQSGQTYKHISITTKIQNNHHSGTSEIKLNGSLTTTK